MAFLDAIDNPLLVFLYAGLAVFSIGHMNKMYYRNTPKMEAAAWWFIGVGAFAVAWFDITGKFTEWGHIMFGVGTALLLGLHAQPEWRPFIANRRRESKPEQVKQERRGGVQSNHGEQAHG